MPKIQIITPDGDETRYALDIESVKIGRTDANDIVVDEDSMSGEHAELNLRAGGNYELTDLDSTNGTRVNGEKIADPVLLNDGDALQFGSVDAQYFSEVSEEAQEELPPPETPESAEPEIAEVSEPPHSFGSMSPFHAKEQKRDGLAIAAIAFAIFGILLSGAAAMMATQMSSG